MATHESEPASPSLGGPNKPNNKKVLVIEDEVPLLKALVDKLAREGFNVLEAMDGAEGLKIALRERPDVILLDLIIPKVGGLDVLKKLRGEDEWGKRVPIIILTNLGLDDLLLREISKNEPSHYLVKNDWHINEVIEKVKECAKNPSQ